MGHIAGIIAEYNPFHLGHKYHLAEVKKAINADYVLCAMSGPFVQRGQAAAFSPGVRAKMALMNGADAVFELPTLFAVREAEFFALGGVSLLDKLGVVTHLAFGAETDNLPLLQKAATLLEAPTKLFSDRMKDSMRQGVAYPKAMGAALSDILGDSHVFSQPNNVLAICYLRALIRLKSTMIPVIIPRIGRYHDDRVADGTLPSATAVRTALYQDDLVGVQRMMPTTAYDILLEEVKHQRICTPSCLDQALRFCLLDKTPEDLSHFPNISEGLDMRLFNAIPGCVTREDLLAALKTKRYPYARLSRLLCHGLLGMTDMLTSSISTPTYARLLGLRSDASALIAQIKQKGSLSIIEKAANGPRENPCFQLDIRAYNLWSIGANLPLGEGYRQQISCL